MPKTTKRAETKRATKIAKAHATELENLEVKEPKERRTPGKRPPARGIARYPWAISLIVLLIALGVYTMYAYHVGPFAPAPVKPKPKTATTAAASPCLNASIIKQITNLSPALSQSQVQSIAHTYKTAPAMSIDAKKTYCAGLNTNRGLIVVELDPNLAPKTVNNFVFLAQHHFYDGLVFHRVIPDTADYKGQLHILQTGDPHGDDPKLRGKGGPGYSFADEPVKGDYTAGTLAMANSGPNTNGSQFFINITDNKSLPKSYNLFGHVVQGMDIVKKIQGPNDDQGSPASAKTITPDTINYAVIAAA